MKGVAASQYFTLCPAVSIGTKEVGKSKQLTILLYHKHDKDLAVNENERGQAVCEGAYRDSADLAWNSRSP